MKKVIQSNLKDKLKIQLRVICIVWILILVCTSLSAQFGFMDSLENRYLTLENDDNEKLRTGIVLAIEYSTTEINLSNKYINNVSELRPLSESKLIIAAMDLARGYQNLAEKIKIPAVRLDEIKRTFKDEKDHLMLGYFNLLLSLYDVRLSRRITSMDYTKNALKYFSESNYQKGQGDAYHAMAFFAKKQNKKRQAISHYRNSIAAYTKAKSVVVLQTLLNLANQFQSVNLPDSALVYYLKSLKIVEQTDQIGMKALIYSNLSTTYLENGFEAKAEEYKEYVLQYQNEASQDENGISVDFPSFFNQGKNQKSKKLISETAKDWRAEKNELVIKQLETENKLKQTRIKLQRLGLISSILLGLFLSSIIILVVRKNRKIKEQKRLIEKSLNEKDTLLREIHHRVKNNLQVISSLLRIQSNQTDDAAALQALKEGQNRVQSMSLIHQDLYQKDNLTGIQMKSYMERLINNLFDTYNISKEKIKISTNIDPLSLDVETVVPLGLMINELISNALKYAFPDNRSGEIEVHLKEINNQLHLKIKDNGTGGIDNSVLDGGDSFGYGLIQAFAHKLDSEINIIDNNGTQVELIINDYLKI